MPVGTSVSSLINDSEKRGRKPGLRVAGLPMPAIAFLILSAAIAVIRSHYQTLGLDEYGFGLLEIDSRSSFGQLIHIQLTRPVSFDPIGYNALIYGIIRCFGSGAFAIRLPSIVGYLLMQACLFWFVRDIVNDWAATAALAFPALLGIAGYSIEARPYGVTLGLSALAMLCWQRAGRQSAQRTFALIGLALSLAAALNMQYYAVLLFVPLCVAELVRTIEFRRLDVPMLVAITSGLAGLILVLPFAKALSSFQANHGRLARTDYGFITHSYLWLLVGYAQLSVRQQHEIGFGFGLFLIALMVISVRLRKQIDLRLPLAEAIFLLTLSALPFLAYVLAIFVTHFVESRYVLPAMIGMSAVTSILLAPLLRNRTIASLVLAALFIPTAAMGVQHIRSDKQNSQNMLSYVAINPKVQSSLDNYPGQPIYCDNHFMFEFIKYYSPSEDMRSRIGLTYWEPTDYEASGVLADVNEQMANMHADGVRHVDSYELLSKPGTEHLFLLYPGPWDLTDQKLAASHAHLKQLGQFFGGDLVSVYFPISIGAADIAGPHSAGDKVSAR